MKGSTGTRVRARRLAQANRSYDVAGNAKRAIVDGKIGVTTGRYSNAHGLCYEVMFKVSGDDGPWTYAWFDANELEVVDPVVIPEQS